MREEPEFNADELITKVNSRRDGLLSKGYNKPQSPLNEKAEKFDGIINSCNEENVENKITDLKNMLITYPELTFATNKKIENSIKGLKSEIESGRERSAEELAVMIKKYNVLKKIREYFANISSKKEE